MRSRAGLTLIAAFLMPAPALAAEPTASERRLSPQQIEAVLAEVAKKRAAAEAQADAVDRKAPRPIQGEAGVTIGTGGHREVFGSAVYPMGDDGAAAISLDFVDLGRRRHKR